MSHSPPPHTPREGQGPALPGSMRAVIPHPFGGKLAMTGFPGLETAVDGSAIFSPDHCHETLCGLHDHGARELVVLVERDELDAIGFELLEATAAEVALAITYHPIVDFAVPSESMTRDWRAMRAMRDAVLRAGGTLAFSCQYGAGRSGLMACWVLMEAGVSAHDAMAQVRAHFAEAVESAAQEQWLRACQIEDPA